MPIHVICPGCHKRFNVSDQFAGQKGPCPGCKTEIQIPSLEDQVQILEPELAPAQQSAKVSLKPIRRRAEGLTRKHWIIVGAVVAVGLALALVIRFDPPAEGESANWIMLFIVALALGPPICLSGYAILREHEAEPYPPRAAINRSVSCGLVYAVMWRLFTMIPDWMSVSDSPLMIGIIGVSVILFSSLAAIAAFDFEFLMATTHVVFFAALMAFFCWIAGDWQYLLD